MTIPEREKPQKEGLPRETSASSSLLPPTFLCGKYYFHPTDFITTVIFSWWCVLAYSYNNFAGIHQHCKEMNVWQWGSVCRASVWSLNIEFQQQLGLNKELRVQDKQRAFGYWYHKAQMKEWTLERFKDSEDAELKRAWKVLQFLKVELLIYFPPLLFFFFF